MDIVIVVLVVTVWTVINVIQAQALNQRMRRVESKLDVVLGYNPQEAPYAGTPSTLRRASPHRGHEAHEH